MYVHGNPYIIYDGPPTEADIKTFIVEMSKKVFGSEFTRRTSSPTSIPSYTIGQPLIGQTEICYLEFNEKEGYHKS
jgi:hypothetical protein